MRSTTMTRRVVRSRCTCGINSSGLGRETIGAFGRQRGGGGRVVVYYRGKQQWAEQEVAELGLGIPGLPFQFQCGADADAVIIAHARWADIARVAPPVFEPARAE